MRQLEYNSKLIFIIAIIINIINECIQNGSIVRLPVLQFCAQALYNVSHVTSKQTALSLQLKMSAIFCGCCGACSQEKEGKG